MSGDCSHLKARLFTRFSRHIDKRCGLSLPKKERPPRPGGWGFERMKRGLSSGRKTRLVFRGTCGTATHGGGSRSMACTGPSRLRLLWCLVGRHQRSGGCGFGPRRFWTRGRVARFKSWPLRRLLALETLLEKATAPPFAFRDCSGGLSGYLRSSPRS